MFRAKVKIDDNDMLKEMKKQKAVLFVGYTDHYKYDAIDEPFYANVAKLNTKGDWGEKIGKPRKFYVQPERTAAEVATFNEFGGGHTPPRPFLRTCFIKNSHKWRKYVQDKFPQNMNINQTFWNLGNRIRGDISDTVIGWTQPPNSPRTIAIKGFNNPLVDSGNMSGDFIDIEVDGIMLEE